MPSQQGGRWRRDKNGELKQVEQPTQEQKFGAHAEHPSKAVAPKAAPSKATSGAKSTAKDKGADNGKSGTTS
ncbi:hypothetical protein ACGLWX_09665 [Halomonas sp. HMF6819]|uniref:hypothetical protein n=1 Tax=Halomonas sp. HMF6819 TaxID=3373085 RepID=UPI0037B80985